MAACQTTTDFLSSDWLQRGRQSRCRGPVAVFSERISAVMRLTYNEISFFQGNKIQMFDIIFVIVHADNLLNK